MKITSSVFQGETDQRLQGKCRYRGPASFGRESVEPGAAAGANTPSSADKPVLRFTSYKPSTTDGVERFWLRCVIRGIGVSIMPYR